MEDSFITVSELQAGISQAIKNVEAGGKYVIMRYSKPSSVLISFKEHQKLKRLAKFARGGACRACQL